MKRTENIGDGLFLVEGMNKWALYDLFGQSIRVVDPGTANYLAQIAQSSAEVPEKLEYLLRETPEIHRNCAEEGILDRMFRPDTSESQAKLEVLDIAWVEITEACNEKCVHCYAESGPVRSRGMSVGTAKKVLDQLKSAKFRKCQIVGGEPLVHKGFWEILEYARSLGFEELEVFSNATLFRNDDLEKLSKMGVSLATSVFGHTEEIHDACTKTPGSFRKWLKNLREAKKLGIPFRIGLVRMRQNETHMDEIRDFLLTEGFIEDESQFGFDDVRESGRGADVSIAPTIRMAHAPYLKVTPRQFHKARRYNPCWFGEMVVSPDGSVHPCVFSRDVTFGNLTKDTVASIVSEQKNKYWAISLDTVDKCKDCEFRYACNDCRSLSMAQGRGLHGAPARCDYDPSA